MKTFHLLGLVAALMVVSNAVLFYGFRLPRSDDRLPAEVQSVASQITQENMTARHIVFLRGEEYWFTCHDPNFPKNHSNVFPQDEPKAPAAIHNAVDAGAIEATVLNWRWEGVRSKSSDGGEYSVVSFFNDPNSQLLIRVWKSDH